MKIGDHRAPLVRRGVRLLSAVQVVLALIALRYWWIQVAEGEVYRELADNNRLRRISLEAPRGLIYDRHGRQLVENVPGYSLLFDRSLTDRPDASLAFAADILGVEVEELRRRWREARSGPFQQVRLAAGLDLAQVARFSVEQLEHPELEIVAEHLRLNRHGEHTAHLLGYLGRVTREDLEAGGDFLPDDLVGRKGIEGRYEPELRGTRGEQLVVVDIRGRVVERLGPLPAEPGRDLTLTLDLDLQQEAAHQLEGRAGAVVALDPHSGDVLALYSAPSFDPNAFGRGLTPAEWEELSGDPRRPLRNRALQTAAPGSLFKIVMALAGLDTGTIDLESRVYCNGAARIYGHRYRCWRAGGHGWETLADALRDSCDVYFYQLGQKLGIEAIARYARMFGLGRPTGLDLGGEMAGLVPSAAWSQRVRGTPWYPGETISVAIGQGPILMTPLQVATMMAAVVRGRLVRPRLVASRSVHRGAALPLPEAHLEAVRSALVDVVHDPEGTGRTARLPGVTLAGKTATAQVVRQETWTKNEDLPPEHRDHAWFAAYGPAAAAELVVVVFVEHGGAGSQAAAPVAKAIFERYFAQRTPAVRIDGVLGR